MFHISFNPRARMGRDSAMYEALQPKKVSIHAPAWDATRCGGFTNPRPWRFNPRARMGRDEAEKWELWPLRGFNPRARMGRDAAFLWLSI